ncbi:kinesin-like protein kif13a [Plakobranchus ocellatus]|uniref:Kinesin-like protein kif13a n=1 Tax=Plakobranchus ocellatus TaxID=259542 RepID=A0AAV3YWZ8_9GAST|nr:kinesin-like protein kif13a [Plakobranchus ocellatus]
MDYFGVLFHSPPLACCGIPCVHTATPKSLLSPLSAAGKVLVKPMRTLLEEKQTRPLLNGNKAQDDDDEDLDEDEEDEDIEDEEFGGDHDHHLQQHHHHHCEENSSSRGLPPTGITPTDNDSSRSTDDSDEGQQLEAGDVRGSGVGAGGAGVKQGSAHLMTPSSTTDSLTDTHGKGYTPSMTSSGYGSQAVSTLTLSSEDSASIKSMEEQMGVTASGDMKPHRKLTSAENSADSEEMEDTGKGEEKKAEREEQGEIGTGLVDREEGLQIERDPESDHYSENAMEELERLGEEDEEECEEDGTGQQSNHASSPPREDVAVITSGEKTVSQPASKPAVAESSKPPAGGKSTSSAAPLPPATTESNSSSAGKKSGGGHSSGGRRKGSGVKPRPMSMVVSPQAEILTRAWQEDSDICPGSSEEHLGGSSEDAMSECSFGSRADLDRLLEGPAPAWIQPGQPASVASSRGGPPKSGLIRFVGPVEFASGPWVGMELDLPEGKNDGSVKGIRYFQCRHRHGVFVRPDKLIWMDSSKRKNSRKNSGPGANNPNRRSMPGLGGSLTNLTAGGGGGANSYMRGTTSSSLKRK